MNNLLSIIATTAAILVILAASAVTGLGIYHIPHMIRMTYCGDSLPPKFKMMHSNTDRWRFDYTGPGFIIDWDEHWTRRGAVECAWRRYHKMKKEEAPKPVWEFETNSIAIH